MNKLVYLSLFVLISACTFASETKFRRGVEAWYGQPEENLIEKLGAPTKFYELNGKRFLTYSGGNTSYVPQTVHNTTVGNNIQTNVYGGYSVNRWCSVTYMVENGIIQSATYKGNDCTSY